MNQVVLCYRLPIRKRRRHYESHIQVVCRDDGAGFDLDAIRAKALELEMLNEPARPARQTVLLVRCEPEIYAVIVDEAIGSEDIVVKGLPEYVPKFAGIAGTAVLGNGNVIAVLETQQLIEASNATSRDIAPARNMPAVASLRQQVLIVDDFP